MLKYFIKSSYVVVAFLSAFLLFWIQPVIARYFTPILGGSPMVWNTLLFFFQFFLLLGYAYTNFLSKWLTQRYALIFHAIFIGCVMLFLPIDLKQISAFPSTDTPVLWLIGNAFFVVGLPFLLLATTAPLLQIWYSVTFKTKEPYFLYSISNIGSFVAIFSFLLLIEPALSTVLQVEIWTRSFIFFVIGIFICGGYVFVTSKKEVNVFRMRDTIKFVGKDKKMQWFFLAFIPASLLHGVTIYITNDLLALPIFWIVPLGLYLLTFVMAFTSFGQRAHAVIKPHVLSLAFLPLLLLFWTDPLFNLTLLVFHVVSFFMLSLICHGELYKQRPDTNNLGSFYLWISLGGACAGFFNVVIAPFIFDTIFEYPLSIAMTVFILLWGENKMNGVCHTKFKWIRSAGFAILFCSVVTVIYYNLPDIFKPDMRFQETNINALNIAAIAWLCILMAIIIFYLFFFKRDALNMSLSFILLHFVVSSTTNHSLFGFFNIDKFEEQKTVFIDRNFFGVIRVIDDLEEGVRKYYNGVGGHSAKAIDSIPVPDIYKGGYRSTAIQYAQKKGLPTAILGMGPARYQCFADKGQLIEYFEINPAVVSMAMDENLFGYFKHCDGKYKVHIGDARLELSRQPNKKYGAILSTVYWSSTVPFHLFTEEALDTYLSKLTDGGYFSIIIPNHFFDFAPLFSAYNTQSPYEFYMIEEPGNYFFRTFILRKQKIFNPPVGWQKLEKNTNIRVWQDDFYNLLDVLKDPKNMRLTRDKKRFDFL